ncbi:MAG TPA: non-heme iron oxygenase ferredoxin subunit [Actinomycetota bacterium]|nr:non-heme iron oxygenase ferredoxin subunit [Actinomycetota bacterium]
MTDDGWIEALPLADVPDGKATRVSLDGLNVLLARDGDRLFAITDRCSHQGAPLSRGPVRFSGSLATVTCPLHGSQFALDTGKAIRGPATRPVDAYDVKVNGDVVYIRDRS